MKIVELFEQQNALQQGKYQINLTDPTTNQSATVELTCFYSTTDTNLGPILEFEYATLDHDFNIDKQVWEKGIRFDYEIFDKFKPFMKMQDYLNMLDEIGEGSFVNFPNK